MSERVVPFHLMLLGPFERKHVHCMVSTRRMSKNPETESLIEEAWNRRLEQTKARGQSLFPGPMCGFRGWSVEDGELYISFGLADYREFVGTNVANPDIEQRFGEAFLANGTGVCSVLLTSDDKIVLQRRSQTVFEHPGTLHFCGGSLSPVDTGGRLSADPFEVMTIEFDEELGLPRSAIVEMSCLGIARDTQTLKPDILLLTRLALPAEAILNFTGDEHSDLIAISNSPAELHQWIGDHWNEVAPAGLACLIAHVSCMFASGLAASWQL